MAEFAAPLIASIKKAYSISTTLLAAFSISSTGGHRGAGDGHTGGVLARLASGLLLADAYYWSSSTVASWVSQHQGGDCQRRELLAHSNMNRRGG